jgi:hypothetical protein
MVELYKFNELYDKWVFIKFGRSINAELYATKGYLVVYI